MTFDHTSESVAAFVRKIDGRNLTFEPGATRAGVALIRDQETGTASGRC